MTYFYLTTLTNNFDILHSYRRKNIRKDMSYFLSRVRYCRFQIIFSSKKTYYISSMGTSVLPISRHQERRPLNSKRNAKKNNTHSDATKTKWYRLYPSLMLIEVTMHASALLQQFTHLVHPNRSHRPSYLLRKTADMTGKIQQ